ncbi:MAG: Uncharacterised protein [Flavobacterium sp. SCGC AAA160-P02]|nr:MAG: Uncharacterised protein [Flavobacterium sp. SCGC AAA160-P02]
MKKLLLIFSLLVFACSGSDNNIDDPILGSWIGVQFQGSIDEIVSTFYFDQNGTFSYSKQFINDPGSSQQINVDFICEGDWLNNSQNVSSDVSLSSTTQYYLFTFNTCDGEGENFYPTLGINDEIIMLEFDNNFQEFRSVVGEDILFVKQ